MFSFFLGELPEFSKSPLTVLQQKSDVAPPHEPIVVNLAGRNTYFLRRPEQIKRVLSDASDDYVKGGFQKRLRPLFGDGLVTAEGDRWKAAREALKGVRLDGGMDLALAVCLEDITRQVASDEPISLVDLTGQLTIRMSTAALTESALPHATADSLFQAANQAHHWFSNVMWRPVHIDLPIPTKGRRQFQALVKTLDDIVGDLRREPKGVFGALASLEDVYGSRAVRDEFVTMLLSGYETTASTAAWLLYVLADRPDLMAWIRTEVDAVLRGGHDLTSNDLKRLPRTRALVDEVLRLYPSAWWFARKAAKTDMLGGVRIPKGADVFICPWLLHRQPDLFPDPNRLVPARWMNSKLVDRWAYVPFGAGPRVCIGQHLARGELTALAALVSAGFDMEPMSGPIDSLRPQGGVTLAAPKDGLAVRFHPRSQEHRYAA